MASPTVLILSWKIVLCVSQWKKRTPHAFFSLGVIIYEVLDGLAVSVLRRAIAEAKERWSVFGWVTKNLLSRAPPCFGRHVKPLVPAALCSR
jgi:hypothetical protein